MAHSPIVIVHGGAGPVLGDSTPARLRGCQTAAQVGWMALMGGGSAVDAVESAVVTLEDDPVFNAGVGSPLNRDGEVELDASIMDGKAGHAGAVAAVKKLKNPIGLARRVMEDRHHILLVSEGAERFARACGISLCDPASLINERQKQHWLQQPGTVGCVALDDQGRLAAATSTGGIYNKHPGRVGDTALIGCGTYATANSAVSCTGVGEAIIRVVLAKTVTDLVESGVPPRDAAAQAVDLLAERTASQAGVIVVDASGEVGYAHNAKYMPMCLIRADGDVAVNL